jgi:hypothetical protein
MATNPNSELVWQGRIHIGDEPGVYGDAHYSGLCAELPLTVFRTNVEHPQDLPFVITLGTDQVTTFDGYPGHEIVVTTYEPDPQKPFHSVEREVARERLTSADNSQKEIVIRPGDKVGPFFISVRLRVDTTVNPGLYDDFLLVKLSFSSENFAYFTSFGFRNS